MRALQMLTNERLGPGVLFGTVASLVCVETALQLLPVEALLRQLPTVASGCKRGWARARDTCCRRGGDADAEAAADAEPAPTKGRQKRANFVEAYMASKVGVSWVRGPAPRRHSHVPPGSPRRKMR